MLKKAIVALCLIVVALSSVAGFWYINIFVVGHSFKKEFKVESGEDLGSILSKIGIEKDLYIKVYLKLSKTDREIKAGYYSLDGTYSKKEILDILKKGSYRKIKITIPEGYTVYQIDKLLTESKLLEEGDLERLLDGIEDFPYPTPNKNFEGYLFPETYFFNEEESGEKVVRAIIGQFLKNYPPEKYPDKEEFYKKVVMASIVEREAGFDVEKALISSVFYNRLKKGMKLQSDATVNYVFNYEKKRIFYKDLEVDSPYNTYQNYGLPPAPIGNPGKASIDASLNPAQTDYYYFVVDGTGGHHFTRTYKEHMEFQNKR